MNRILVAALICGLAAPAFAEERPIGTGQNTLASRSATSVIIVDSQTGLPSSAGGGGGGAITAASGSYASGAFSSGSIASGAFAAGALAAGSVSVGAYSDGAIVGIGALGDTAWTSGNGSLIALGKAMVNAINTQLPAGTNTIGQIRPFAVTPAAATASAIVTGGTAVTAVTGAVNGCYITNPTSATDEGIGAAENLYVNPVTTATTTGNGTTLTLVPGQTFFCIPGQTTNVSVVAATTAHAFTVVKW